MGAHAKSVTAGENNIAGGIINASNQRISSARGDESAGFGKVGSCYRRNRDGSSAVISF